MAVRDCRYVSLAVRDCRYVPLAVRDSNVSLAVRDYRYVSLAVRDCRYMSLWLSQLVVATSLVKFSNSSVDVISCFAKVILSSLGGLHSSALLRKPVLTLSHWSEREVKSANRFQEPAGPADLKI